jgi:hypothetical protein
MPLPTPKEVAANRQYYADLGQILIIMATSKETKEKITPAMIDEIRAAGWGICRVGENFEGGFMFFGE